MRILTHTVLPEEEGRMVKGILRGSLQLSYTLLKSLKWRENAILLNGQSVHVNAIVHAGDVVSVALSERTPREDLYCKNTAAPNIVYEDEDLLVLNKPAGVAMHPKADDAAAPSLAAMLTGYLGEGSVPHFVSRLDKGTSGLLIAAKSGYVHDRLRRALHSSELRREYRAVAVGQVTPPRGIIDAPIGRADGSIIRRCVREDGLVSRTEYEVLQTTERFTLLHLRPETGRTHQLRVHMAYLGHPLAGDWLYGTEDKNLIARPALHSYELWFTQPVTGQELHFTAPIPQDMQRLLE
ncbi:MAG: RluA family pseudouridine synthase [Oscillibacter sp.]|nr:RluA family pseudouridine synthase [Oscillibacter sp.]MDY4907976.1 RluA family pseudouridine synthase [Oscillospiraceae bacterium]